MNENKNVYIVGRTVFQAEFDPADLRIGVCTFPFANHPEHGYIWEYQINIPFLRLCLQRIPLELARAINEKIEEE